MSQNTMEENRLDSKPVGLAMRAVEYDQYGDAEVLHMADHPVPQRLRGQFMIEVLASSVNPIDYRFRRGGLVVIEATAVSADGRISPAESGTLLKFAAVRPFFQGKDYYFFAG